MRQRKSRQHTIEANWKIAEGGGNVSRLSGRRGYGEIESGSIRSVGLDRFHDRGVDGKQPVDRGLPYLRLCRQPPQVLRLVSQRVAHALAYERTVERFPPPRGSTQQMIFEWQIAPAHSVYPSVDPLRIRQH